MTGGNRRENIAAAQKLSASAMEAAVRNAAAQDYRTAANRLYYAAYHSATAVCLSEGLEPKTHRGLHHLLKLHFIEPGQLPDWVDSTFSRLQSDRDLADYEPDFVITAERYSERHAEATKLLATLTALLRAGGWIE